jgi:hypothetical protein
MEHYDFAKVWSDEKGLRLHCTDFAEADALLSQLKQFYRKVKLKHETGKLPSGEIFFHHIKDDYQFGVDKAMWWIIKQLCSRGWEPIGAASAVYGTASATDFHYQFRRKSIG